MVHDTPAAPAATALTPDAAESAASVLRALADPLRLRIVAALGASADGHLTAGEVASLTDLTAPTVSHHLRALRDAGVVRVAARGTYRDYSAAPGMARLVVAVLDALASARARAAQPADAPTPGTVDDQATLRGATARLTARHPDAAPQVVDLVLRDSYAALARTATVGRHLAVLAERFADQRLADVATAERPASERRPQVLFVCTANAGRSQLAAALLRRHAGDALVARSAGSMPAPAVHATVRSVLDDLLGRPAAAAGVPPTDAVRTAHLDDTPYPKPLTDDALRAADVVITMGCGDSCPVLPGKRYEDWPVADPALAGPAGVAAVVADLDSRVRALVADLLPHVPA